MLSSLLTVGANIILAPVFIFSFDWGIRGAALATVISQSCGVVWILAHFFNKKSFTHFQKGCFVLKRHVVGSIFSIGMSPFLMNVCACTVVIIVNNSFKAYGGDMAIGAYGIVNRVLTLFVMIVIGLTQGMQPVIGYNYGAKHFDRVKKTLKLAIISGVAITSTGFILSQFLPHSIVAMFTDDNRLNDLAEIGLCLACLMFPLVGCQIVITNFFQSIGKAKVSIFLSLSRQLFFLIPCLIILPRYWGVNGVWCSMPVSDFIASVIAGATLLWYFRKQKVNFFK